jgi:hypothetical protein
VLPYFSCNRALDRPMAVVSSSCERPRQAGPPPDQISIRLASPEGVFDMCIVTQPLSGNNKEENAIRLVEGDAGITQPFGQSCAESVRSPSGPDLS